MPIGEVLATILMAAAWIVAGRRQSTWRAFPQAGAFGLLLTLVVLWRDGLRPVIIAGPISGSTTVGFLLVAAVSWAYVLGLPRPVALRLGIGLTSRQLGFNNKMIDVIGPFYAAFVRAQEDPARRDAELAECERLLRRLSSLRPPDAPWAALRDGLVAEYRYWLELVRTEPLPAYDINAAPALERWRAMQEEAAQAQKDFATPTRRRRGEAIWCSTTAAATILIGLGRLPSILYRGTFSLDVVLTGASFVVAAWALREAGLRISGRRGPGWA